MTKTVKIEVLDRNRNFGGSIFEDDCPNIINKVKDNYGEITDEVVLNAIDTLIAAMATRPLNSIYIDIEERERALAPAKEMTLEDIEEALGYKVKIVSK